MKKKELIRAMALKNGSNIVIAKLKEELAELSLAMARLEFANVMKKSPFEEMENIFEEIVDAEIMIKQFKVFISGEKLKESERQKLERIKQLLDADV